MEKEENARGGKRKEGMKKGRKEWGGKEREGEGRGGEEKKGKEDKVRERRHLSHLYICKLCAGPQTASLFLGFLLDQAPPTSNMSQNWGYRDINQHRSIGPSVSCPWAH